MSTSKSSLGMDENIAGLLSYVFGFLTGIIFFIVEKDSAFVKFHAMQSILFSVAIFVIRFVLEFIPIIGGILSWLVSACGVIVWLFLMYQAYLNERFKLPFIGDIAESQVK